MKRCFIQVWKMWISLQESVIIYTRLSMLTLKMSTISWLMFWLWWFKMNYTKEKFIHWVKYHLVVLSFPFARSHSVCQTVCLPVCLSLSLSLFLDPLFYISIYLSLFCFLFKPLCSRKLNNNCRILPTCLSNVLEITINWDMVFVQ